MLLMRDLFQVLMMRRLKSKNLLMTVNGKRLYSTIPYRK